MSEPETQPTRTASHPALPKAERLCWWITIYSVAQVSLVIKYGSAAVGLVLFFPMIVGGAFVLPFAALVPEWPGYLTIIGITLAVILGYGFYILHLAATLRAPTRLGFDLLLLLLVACELLSQFFILGPIR